MGRTTLKALCNYSHCLPHANPARRLVGCHKPNLFLSHSLAHSHTHTPRTHGLQRSSTNLSSPWEHTCSAVLELYNVSLQYVAAPSPRVRVISIHTHVLAPTKSHGTVSTVQHKRSRYTTSAMNRSEKIFKQRMKKLKFNINVHKLS